MVLTRLPEITDLSPVYFLDLRILGDKGEIKDTNFYCLARTPDILDFEKTTWFVTPVKQYADLTQLNSLPEAQIKYRWKVEGKGPTKNLIIELDNLSPNLAFNLEIQVLKKLRQKSLLPLFLEDNYFSLLPGEKRIIKGYFFSDDLEGDEVEIRIKGWNVQAIEQK
jgi:exo-1,4-beta-D-glucosaminidase